jgi:tetratricopeptide (TPR) repeat protein
MTKRKMQHQLEDFSRYKFGLALPTRWVFRDKDKDYGIDGEVEIFDSKEKATGLVFWVQLKATRSEKERTIKGIDLSLETISYYKRLDIPVLIIRYSEARDVFYVKWASDIDPFYAKENAKTMRVNFTDSDMWVDATAGVVEKYLIKVRAVKSGAIRLPVKFSLSFGSNKVCDVATGVLRTKIRSDLNSYQNILRLVQDHENAIADVYVDERTLKIGILGIAGCTFHSVDLMSKSTLSSDLIKDIALGLALATSQLGYSDLAARIIFSNDVHKRLEKKPEIVRYILPSLLKTSYFEQALELVGNVCDNEDSNFLEIIANSAVLFLRDSKHDDKCKAVEVFLKRNSERYKNTVPELYGVSLYNLGNFYRSINKLKESIKCYLLARRYEPKYYKQEYFFGELAGALFDLGKYKYSAQFYKKAIDFNENKEWRPQCADALMFAGEYQKALDLFEAYLSSTNDQTAEWNLKVICLPDMIGLNNTRSQIRQVKEAMSLADIDNCKDADVEARLKNALSHDLLCGLAWYNLGQLKYKEGEINATSFCFTACSLVQRWDIEAWVNATVSSFNKEIPINTFVLIVRAAYFCNGDNYIEALYELIESQSGEEALAHIASVIEQIISTESKKESRPELRFLDEDGKYKVISEFHHV